MTKDKYNKRVAKRSKEIMTVQEVADFLQLTPITIYKLVKTKELPSFKIGGSVRFHRAYIEAMGKTGTE